MSKKLEGADEVCAENYEACIEQLRIDAEVQRQLEAEEIDDLDYADPDAEDDDAANDN